MIETPVKRCLIADGHPAVLSGLKSILEQERDLAVVGQASTGSEALRMAEKRRPDIALLGVPLSGDDDLEPCREMATLEHPPAVVLYTEEIRDESLVEQALAAGAQGVILKSGPLADVAYAMRIVADGHQYIDGRLAPLLLRRRMRDDDLLSPRERDVLQLLANGRSTEAVGAALYLSPATIRSYTESAMRTLEGRNRVHAVANALRAGLID
jgi:two-component system response regulator DesR